MRLYLNDVGLLCALGRSRQEILPRLLAGDRSGLGDTTEFGPTVIVGRCDDALPEIGESLQIYDCRNNRLLLAALSQIRPSVEYAIERLGSSRIGVVLGTSTSGVRSTELALAHQEATQCLPEQFHYKQQQMGAGAEFISAELGISGPAITLSTACSSSGKAFAAARRMIKLGYCDAAIVGGADTLCNLTINGFAALESLSTGLCKPFGRHRDGINIGEAASLFLLSKEPGPVELLGIGASSDAYHYSAPDPEGTAVIFAMRKALQDAGLQADDIDYINLHGTATVLNDAMESKAVNTVFGEQVPASSSKGLTGHTLGAAAALELGFCWSLLTENPDNRLIPNINDDLPDETLAQLHLVEPVESSARDIHYCQSNSFAFGGNNISIIIGKA
jgi:3-oxoacyl-[acyl-carrier-protein] synthase I